ncbi:MAG TPA: hypothetical protein VM529_13890 [Gemmata sp.]|nr:hypothetical protein [Gemmata sp.]
MRRTFWVVVAVSVAGGVGAGAGEKRLPDGPVPSVPVLADRADPAVEKLVADLGSEDYRTREKAGRDLTALGEKALPAMRTALLSTDNPEIQRRLSVLVRKMDNDRLVAPKRVTMALKDKTVKEALDEITKQTGYKIDFSGGGGEARQDFTFDGTPFWVAVDKVATAAGCVVFADYDDETVRVYNQDAVNPYVAYAGPFRFLATNINSNKSVQLSGVSRRGGGNGRSDYMNLNFQIQSEPKNPMLGVTQAEVISAVDDLGASLVPPRDPNNRSYYENRGMRGHNTYGNLNLSRGGGRDATTIKSLKGRIGIILLAGTSPEITIPDPLKVKTKTYVGRTVQIEYGGLTADANNKGHYQLELTIKKLGNEDPNRPDYNWSNNIWNKFEVLDADGNRYQTHGPNNFNNNGNAVTVTIPYHNNDRRTGRQIKLGPPAKFVVNEWHSVTHEVTFEFKDIPLP